MEQAEMTQCVAILQNAHIVKLTSAARMAGMRWKSGTAGYDKQGIIAKLQNSPSIMRATIAALARLDKTAIAPSTSLLDDLRDDANIPTPTTAPPGTMQHAPNIDLSQYVQRPEMLARFDVERKEIDARFNDVTITLVKMAETFQQNRPIQINIVDKPPIVYASGAAHKSYAKLLQYLHINHRVILTGSAGTGKSMAAKNAAKDLGLDFYLLPPVFMSHELIGHRDAQGVFHHTALTLAYINGGLILMDEQDASMPDALLCANPILDGNGFATLGDGQMHAQHPDFRVVFNMNTDGNGATLKHAGRNRLDGATLARFGVRINWEIDSHIEYTMSDGQSEFYRAMIAVRDFMVARDIQDVNATPRHTKTGAALLNAKAAPKREIFEDVLKSGALGQLWTDVLRLPAVASFLQ